LFFDWRKFLGGFLGWENYFWGIESCVAVAFLLYLGFVFASAEGGAPIGVVVFVAEDLGFVIQL
jgi:hypothetical protein